MSRTEWREIAGTQGNYFVSDDGQVWSRPRKNSSGGLLKIGRNSHGYLVVDLSVNGKTTTRRVHRLVIEAFAGPPDDGHECRHLDGDKTNNRIDNLVWGTRSENAFDRVRHGTHATGSKTECLRGHPFDETNTRIRPDGSRLCRECHRQYLREWRRKRADGKAAA